jgi:glycosyltransferase involved in cell wall biosynthesis
MNRHIRSDYPEVSIVMPALNVAQHLDHVFDAIAKIAYPKKLVEVILVDNGSQDETVAIAKRRGAIVIEKPDARIGGLRNWGASMATGSILAFLDSDCVVDPSWLNSAIPLLMRNDVGAVGCHTRVPEKATWVEKTLDFHATREGVNEVRYLPTANLIMRKAIFEQLGGFDPSLETGEDSDLCHRISDINLKLISDTNILAVHMGYPKDLKQLFRKEIWHSIELFSLLLSTQFNIEYILGIGVPFLYALLLVLACAFLGTAILTKNWMFFFSAVICCLIIPILLAIYKSLTKKNIRYFFFSAIYFAVILLARIRAGITFLSTNMFKRHSLTTHA